MNRKKTFTEGYSPDKIRNRTTLGAFTMGVMALGLIVIVFLIGLRIFPLTAGLPDTYPPGEGGSDINWNILDGVAGLATFSLVVGGVVFAFIDYVQNAVQRKREDAEASFNIYREMYDRLMNPQALEARRWIIMNLPTLEEMGNDQEAWLECIQARMNKTPRGWKGRPPGKEYLKDILNTFDFIGFVAKHYWNMENELVQWMSPPIAKVWERIYLYVEEEAKQRNEPDYYQSAREFGNYCMQWRRDHQPKSTIIQNGT